MPRDLTLARPGGPSFSIGLTYLLSYRPGSQNTKPDALSRLYDPEPAAKEPEHILPLNRVVGGVT